MRVQASCSTTSSPATTTSHQISKNQKYEPSKKVIPFRSEGRNEYERNGSTNQNFWDGAYRKSCDFCIEKKLKCSGKGTTCRKCVSKGIRCTYSLKHRAVLRARDMGVLASDLKIEASDNVSMDSEGHPEFVKKPVCQLPSISDLLGNTASEERFVNNFALPCKHSAQTLWKRFTCSSESGSLTDDSGSTCGSEIVPPENMGCTQPVQTLHQMLERLAQLQEAGQIEEVVLQLKAMESAGFITEQFCNFKCEQLMILSQAKIMCSIRYHME